MSRNAPARRRLGVTLIEVLVAIFIMAIGLMALLTLFPLGALSMAQAVKDDRTGTASRNAEALFRTYWRYAVTNMGTEPDTQLRLYMLNPGGGLDNRNPRDPAATITRGPSYPVFVDGFGWLQQGQGWLANRPGGVRRWVPAIISGAGGAAAQQAAVVNYFSSPDDISLGQSGLPISPVARERRYSWGYLIRQLDVRQDRHVELTVVVYANRPLTLNAELLFGETAYDSIFTKGSNVATLAWGAGEEKPAIRRGGWILDATMPPAGSPASVKPHGFFYRVVNVTDGTNTMELELESAAKEGDGNPHPRSAIVLEGVVEVFERGVVSE